MITEECMPQVRWLHKNVAPMNLPGKVLQQKWKITTYHLSLPESISYEWRDVPVLTE